MKTVLKIIGSFVLVLAIIFVAAGIWFKTSSSKYDEVAKPFVINNINVITSWDFEKLKPLLTPKASKELDTLKGKKLFRMFSKLGTLQSHEEPMFMGAEAGAGVTTGTEDGIYDVVSYSVVGHFSSGDAIILVTLTPANDTYLINYMHINSDAFLN